MNGTVYLVPNTLDCGTSSAIDLQEVLPLGTIRIASRLNHWVAENAKTARAFLKRVDAVVPLVQPLQTLSIIELARPAKGHQQLPAADMKPLLQPALLGADIGLISDAGMPAVADPGAMLVQAAHALGIRVLALSGPNSLLLALASSGLNGQSFAFVGYLPTDTVARSGRITELETLSKRLHQTQLMIETPYRNQTLLHALINNLKASTWLSVSCGLTLSHGWSRTDRVARWKSQPDPIANDTPAVFSLLCE